MLKASRRSPFRDQSVVVPLGIIVDCVRCLVAYREKYASNSLFRLLRRQECPFTRCHGWMHPLMVSIVRSVSSPSLTVRQRLFPTPNTRIVKNARSFRTPPPLSENDWLKLLLVRVSVHSSPVCLYDYVVFFILIGRTFFWRTRVIVKIVFVNVRVCAF